MNVPTIKLVCWLAALASAGGLTELARGWFGNIEQRQLPVDPDHVARALDEDLRVAPDVREMVDYDDLRLTFKTMNWTGAPEPDPVDDEDEVDEPRPEPKPVEQILAVAMLSVDTGDPGGSMAHVTYRKERLPAVLRVGQALIPPYDHAVVYRIRKGLIEFAFTDPGRENEVLGPDTIDPELIVRTDGPILARHAKLPMGTTSEKERREQTENRMRNLFELGARDVETLANDYQRILTEDVTTDTYWKDGKRAGVEIKSVKEGSIVSRHGAQQGDVLISINGHEVTSETEAISFVKSNSSKVTAWEVVVLRYGQEETLVYY